MKSKLKQSFASIIDSFGNNHDHRLVFDDFLKMSICACAQNPLTGKSFYEDEYMEIIGKYEAGTESMLFKHMFATMVDEMTMRLDSDTGYDVLGEYFENHLVEKSNRNNQFFTPWPVCKFMSEITLEHSKENQDNHGRLKILDPACGSGRMLMAAARIAGPEHNYFAIDIDPVCCRITILNLFLSGLFHAEAMCANALITQDFKFSHRTRLLPFGIYRIDKKEQSVLWNTNQAIMEANKQEYLKRNEPAPWSDEPKASFGEQMRLL